MASASQRNEALARALLEAGVRTEDVADQLKVNLRTIDRWVAGQVPYPANQGQLAKLLGVEAATLWPPRADRGSSGDDFVAIHAHRADVPAASWWSQLSAAERHIDLLGYAILFLPEAHPRLNELLTTKGAAGCSIRIALVDPASPEAAARDAEEELQEGLLARIRTSLRYLSPLLGRDGIELRQHATPMYNSVFRFDEEMFVTPHLYRLPGFFAPLLHLRRMTEDGVFDGFADHFARIWTTAVLVEAKS